MPHMTWNNQYGEMVSGSSADWMREQGMPVVARKIENTLAVVGSRTFPKLFLVRQYLDFTLVKALPRERSLFDKIVSGGAKGPDSIAEEWAHDHMVSFLKYEADWNTEGKKAGMLRNTKIINNAHAVWAFWDGYSKGTEDSIQKAVSRGVPTKIILPSGGVVNPATEPWR